MPKKVKVIEVMDIAGNIIKIPIQSVLVFSKNSNMMGHVESIEKSKELECGGDKGDEGETNRVSSENNYQFFFKIFKFVCKKIIISF